MTPLVLFVIGVSGCGKSTVADAIAKRIGGTFLEGDAFHPAANVAAMSAGQPLNDEMRWGWLNSLGQAAKDHADQGADVVVACSGLKQSYRNLLRTQVGACQMIFLDGEKKDIEQRLNARSGHYMPAKLLDSQFADLERPTTAETDVHTVQIKGSKAQVIDAASRIAISLKEGLAQPHSKS